MVQGSSPTKSQLVLVLVEPSGPLNVGSVARLCANFGVDRLRLVAPRCDPLSEEARRMAVAGRHLLEAAERFPTLASAIADCGRVVAATGRTEAAPLPPGSPSQVLRWLLAAGSGRTGRTLREGAGPCASALVFGREDRGLSNDELLQAGRLLRIGTFADYPSLNLSHAVAVVLHELWQLRDLPSQVAASRDAEPCPRGELEAALADARDLLLEAGFLLPHTAHARMVKLRRLLQRAEVEREEVALIRGMVCQLRWACRHLSHRADAP